MQGRETGTIEGEDAGETRTSARRHGVQFGLRLPLLSTPEDRASRPRRTGLALLAAVVGGLLSLGCSSAFAAGETGHVLSKVFTPTGPCALSEPGTMAVSDATHDAFVVERSRNALLRFNPEGQCMEHRKPGVGSTVEPENEGLAIDNTTGGPSSGDLYYVNSEEHAILKFAVEPTGLKQVAKIKFFHLKQTEEQKLNKEQPEVKEFPEIYGIGVDSNGQLWVYTAEGVIDHFGNAEKVNEFLGETPTELPCSQRPGFAVAPDGSFWIGRERESRGGECEEPDVRVHVGPTGEAVNETAAQSQLDNENTTGMAIDDSSGPTAGDLYFDNATSVSAFKEDGTFIQRLGNEGPDQLKEATGIGLDDTNNNLFVADANFPEGRIELFTPTELEERKPEEPAEGNKSPEPTPLADNRTWEQVSPQNKFGAQLSAISLEHGIVQASEDGSALTYSSSGPIVPNPPANRALEPLQNVSRRGTESWSTEQVTPPRPEIPEGYNPDAGDELRFFSSDLAKGVVEPQEAGPFPGYLGPHEKPALSPGEPETTVYLRDLTRPDTECEPVPSSCYTPLVSSLNDTSGVPYGAHVEFASATPNAEYSVLRSDVPLTNEAKSSEEEGIYEHSPSGALQLVSILPEAEELENKKKIEEGKTENLISPSPAGVGRFISADVGVNARNAISENGNRIVWSTEQGLYLRDMARHESIRLDLAREGLEQPEEPAIFQLADTEGNHIFFTDKQPLLAHATTRPGSEELEGYGDLYECEVVETGGKLGCNLRDLTERVEAENGPAAVQGVIGVSKEGSTIYYVADGIFTGGVHAGNCDAREGESLRKEEEAGEIPVLRCNLYEQHFNGKEWLTPTFVASLTTHDLNDWTLTTERGGLGTMTARVSESGKYLAFMSDESLTGYNNVDSSPEAKGARDEEVFLWNSGTGRIACPSCNANTSVQPTGVFDKQNSGEGNGLFVDRPLNWQNRWLDGSIPGWTGVEVGHALYQSRYLNDEGRMFFNSASELVPADKNHKEDVYEYEPSGVGTCASATGCVSLMSGGRPGTKAEPETESSFLDASKSGNDVFFLSSSKLTPTDTDTAFDVYDAHACSSSSPCLAPPPEKAATCTGEGCRPAVTTQPGGPTALPTASPSGGNTGGAVHVLPAKTGKPPASKPKPTKAQLLAKALKTCHKYKSKHKRHACEASAQKKYGKHKTKKAKKSARKAARR
ncbi:MAG TPA: hypothetical protein VHT27_11700 [Solirubrobacteraceae bacterium]|jgi:hypothetical protein|nr:hypothetical protein [Solirubrobacteraceae bacterium]